VHQGCVVQLLHIASTNDHVNTSPKNQDQTELTRRLIQEIPRLNLGNIQRLAGRPWTWEKKVITWHGCTLDLIQELDNNNPVLLQPDRYWP
jgi:hypothetical protein